MATIHGDAGRKIPWDLSTSCRNNCVSSSAKYLLLQCSRCLKAFVLPRRGWTLSYLDDYHARADGWAGRMKNYAWNWGQCCLYSTRYSSSLTCNGATSYKRRGCISPAEATALWWSLSEERVQATIREGGRGESLVWCWKRQLRICSHSPIFLLTIEVNRCLLSTGDSRVFISGTLRKSCECLQGLTEDVAGLAYPDASSEEIKVLSKDQMISLLMRTPEQTRNTAPCLCARVNPLTRLPSSSEKCC